MWYDLSDVKLAEALDDRVSFRRYCGSSTSEATPERTTFVRFRNALITQALDKALFDEITAQLKVKAIRVKTGTLVDATIIAPRGKRITRRAGSSTRDAWRSMVSRLMWAPTPARLWSGKSRSRRPTSMTARPAPALFRLARAPIASDGLRSRVPLCPFQRPPPTDARSAHAKATSRAAIRRSFCNS
jgi:IS5 family transposase